MTALKQLSDNESDYTEKHPTFEILYEHYYTRVYRYIRAHLHSDDDTADLVQQIFFQIWMQINTYQPRRGTLSTWIFSIAHHRLVDHYRATRRATICKPLDEITLTEQSPEEIIISAEALTQVQALLDTLTDTERRLLALRFAARLSLVEIAAIFGKNVDAIRKQLTRLIQRLSRQYYQQDQAEILPELHTTIRSALIVILHQLYLSSLPIVRVLIAPCVTRFSLTIITPLIGVAR